MPETAFTLPARYYTDAALFRHELDGLFGTMWCYAGRSDEAASPGQYFVRELNGRNIVVTRNERGDFLMVEIGGDSVFVVADDDGIPRAFHNVCRHRGARLVQEPEGRMRRLQCPYHAWTYGFDGALRSAPFTEGLEDFDAACNGLAPVRLAVVEGLVLIDLSGTAPSPQEHVGELEALMARYRFGELRRGARLVYDVGANWKAIAENYSECLHCPGVHPELNRLSHYLSGETYEGAGAWCGGSMTLADGVETMAVEGSEHNRPAIEGVDVRSILYFLLFPNTLVSLHPDYVMLHTLWPQAPDRTRVVCEWFFEASTMAAPDFDPGDAVGFWDQVNREDWHVCELTQAGMGSKHYVPGRYTTQETDVHAFDVMVADRYMEGALVS